MKNKVFYVCLQIIHKYSPIIIAGLGISGQIFPIALAGALEKCT